MPDTGAAAGQEVEMALQLTRSGVPLSYANAAAFELAGWLPVWRMAQALQTFTYTIAPDSDVDMAADGWHLLVLTLVVGEGDLRFKKPSGTGWVNFPKYYRIRAESVDQRDIYNAILRQIGVAVAGDTAVVVDYTVTDDDSFSRQFTALNSSLALFGYDSSDLTDGTLTLEGSVRAVANRAGIPDAWMVVTPVTATDGVDPVLRISWGDYPSAVASVQLGLDYPSTDITNDAEIGPLDYSWQVRAVGMQTFAVTAVVTGASGTGSFRVGGDRRRWFAKGGSFRKTVSGANTWTVLNATFDGSNTFVTITGAIVSGAVDGNLEVDVKITLGMGTIRTNSRDIRP